MKDSYEPFEVVEEDGRTVLRLRGTQDQRKKVEADKVFLILDAIAEGWDIDIVYVDIDGSLNINSVSERLERGDNGKLIVKSNITIGACRISGNVWFIDSRFSGHVEFSSSSFCGDAYFRGSSFCGNVYFINSRFSGDAYFRDSSFGGDAYFRDSSFGRDPALDSAKFAETSSECFDSIGQAYKRSLLPGAGQFFEKAGTCYSQQEPPEYSKASDSFRNAKVEYDKEGKYDEAGKAYVKERDSITQQLATAKARRKLEKDEVVKLTWFRMWRWSSNYGEDTWLFVKRAAFVVAVFAVIYMPIIPALWKRWPSWLSITFGKYPFHQYSGGIIGVIKAGIFNLVTALYFSVVTFATLGFGDIAPVSVFGKICTIVEVLLGYVMFGVLITLVARKMIRS